MNKIAVNLCVVATIILSTGCSKLDKDISIDKSQEIIQDEQIIKPEHNTDKENVIQDEEQNSSTTEKKSIVKMPIEIITEKEKEVKYLEINENDTLKVKIETILNVISSEHFNNLPMKAVVYEKSGKARIELLEDENNRTSWKVDYLNEYTKDYTINNIVKNILQEEYKGTWIKEVQLYYQGELIVLN